MKSLKFYSYEYDEAYNRLLAEVQDGFHMLDPVLRLFPPVETMHGGPIRYIGPEAPFDMEHSPIRYKASGDVDISDIDVEAHTVFLHDFAQAYVEAMTPRTVEAMLQVCDAMGQSVSAEGKPMTWDVWLDGIEKLELGMDENGEPVMPQYLMHPETEKKVVKALQELPPTIEQRQRMQAILDKKKRDYAAKRTRRLSR